MVVNRFRGRLRAQVPAPPLQAPGTLAGRRPALSARSAPGRPSGGSTRSGLGLWASRRAGTLPSMTGTHFDAGRPDAADPIERVSSRPDLMILSVAVITMRPPHTHAWSVQNLLGENPDEQLLGLLLHRRTGDQRHAADLDYLLVERPHRPDRKQPDVRRGPAQGGRSLRDARLREGAPQLPPGRGRNAAGAGHLVGAVRGLAPAARLRGTFSASQRSPTRRRRTPPRQHRSPSGRLSRRPQWTGSA